jgi:cell division protein FtsB
VDDFKPNRSVDGMVGGQGVPPRQPDASDDNLGYNDQNNTTTDELTDLGQVEGHSDATANSSASVQAQAHESNNLHITGNGKDPSKKWKVMTILFAILFIASAVFAYYQYTQVQDLQKKVDAANSEVTKLKSDLESVKYDGKDMTNKQDLLTKQNQALTALSKQLKTACGNACRDISLEIKVSN